MNLILESIINYPERVSDISVIVVNKEKRRSYKYTISSGSVSTLRQLLGTRQYGQALNLLKKEDING